MNSTHSITSLCVQIVWPFDALLSIAKAPKQPSALILCVQDFREIKEHFLDSGLAKNLAESGVSLFALIGEQSERVHDALDWSLEEIGADDVITSWHDQDDLEDVVTFVTASCRASGLTRILVVLDESTVLGRGLREAIDKVAE